MEALGSVTAERWEKNAVIILSRSDRILLREVRTNTERDRTHYSTCLIHLDSDVESSGEEESDSEDVESSGEECNSEHVELSGEEES